MLSGENSRTAEDRATPPAMVRFGRFIDLTGDGDDEQSTGYVTIESIDDVFGRFEHKSASEQAKGNIDRPAELAADDHNGVKAEVEKDEDVPTRPSETTEISNALERAKVTVFWSLTT